MAGKGTNGKKRVVVAGMGFGGMHVAKGLAGSGMEVLLLDRNNYHLFQPLLYQVATAGLEQESIAYPIRALVRGWYNLSFRMGEITGIDAEGSRIITGSGPIEYDYLVLACGSVTNFFGNSSVEEHAYDLKRLTDAERLRNSILAIFEQAINEHDESLRKELLTFVVVGGGPTGVEFAGALSELIRFVFRKDYPSLALSECRVILLEAGPAILSSMPETLREYAEARLIDMGVELRCGAMVSGATENEVFLASGEIIRARTLFWSAGVKASPVADMLQCETGACGRVIVSPELNVNGHDNLFVVGDMALFVQNGRPLPMMAPVAMQQGDYVADAILKLESGDNSAPFCYVDKGSMATIGRSSAVAHAFGLSFRGFSAWLVWLFLHLYYLIGFRNRIVVLLNWAWYYCFHERQVRLITALEATKFNKGG